MKKKIDIDLEDYIVDFYVKPSFALIPFKIKIPLGEYLWLAFLNMLMFSTTKRFISVPFPQATIMFTPKVRVKKVPVRKYEPIAFEEGAEIPTTMSMMEVKTIEYKQYAYTLPSVKMLDYLFPRYPFLCIKKIWLLDGVRKGVEDGFTFDFYELAERLPEVKVDSFYKLI